MPKSGSNIETNTLSTNLVSVIASSLYYSLSYPLFFNSKNTLQYVASLENLLILASLLIFLIGIFKTKKDQFIPIAFVTFALLLCFLIGLTTPNSGAIFRYRGVAVIFTLLAALYYLPISKNINKQSSN